VGRHDLAQALLAEEFAGGVLRFGPTPSV